MVRSLAVLMIMGVVASAAPALEPISSAERCGSCHRAIEDAWKKSAHARAMDSRLFQDALALVESDAGEGARRQCLTCHSPLGVQIGDFALKMKVSWEGVTCDYCHSMRSVVETGPNPKAVMEYSLTKSGPIRDASPVGHSAVFSEVHTTSQVCAPCHQYQNGPGLAVLTTYSEWKQSRYGKEAIQCQECHMGRVEGEVVDPGVRSSGAPLNLHEMPGSHSLDQLNKAVRMRLSTNRTDNQLVISVLLENSGAGHYVPTGSPARQLILDVTANAYQGQDLSERRVYRRVVADGSGQNLDLEYQIFLRGAKTVSDTRLAPDEKRTETFTLPVARNVPVQVTATLTYYYSPMARSESQKEVHFRNITRLVR